APEIDVAAEVNCAAVAVADTQHSIDGDIVAVADEAQRLDHQGLVVDRQLAGDRAFTCRAVTAQRRGETRERRGRQQFLARIEARRFEREAPGPGLFLR